MGLIALLIFSHPNYVGYAGSPVSSGSCASSCHGNGTFTVNVSGFPTEYQPGESYQITISPSYGSIKNFNACILDLNNQPQGTLQGAFNTTTYSHPGEGTGVHGTSYDQSSYTFTWIAPPQQVGEVRLYIAAHQGNKHGPNRNLTLTSNPMSISESDNVRSSLNNSLRITPVLSSGTIRIEIPKIKGYGRFTIYSSQGVLIKDWRFKDTPEAGLIINWTPDRSLPSGVYWILLQTRNHKEVQKFIRIPQN